MGGSPLNLGGSSDPNNPASIRIHGDHFIPAGPIFGERAQTLRRGRVLAGIGGAGLHFKTLRGVDLDHVRFTFTHFNSDFTGGEIQLPAATVRCSEFPGSQVNPFGPLPGWRSPFSESGRELKSGGQGRGRPSTF